MTMRSVNDICLNLQVVADEVRRSGVVGANSSHSRSREDHALRAHFFEESAYGLLDTQVELLARLRNQILETKTFESPHDCRARQTRMACNIDAR